MALGVHFLPQLVSQMSLMELADFYAWQVRMFLIQLDGVKELQGDFHALGFTAEQAIRLGQVKQLHAARLVTDQVAPGVPFEEIITRIIECRLALDFSPEDTRRRDRWHQAAQALLLNSSRTRDIQRELSNLSKDKAA